MIEAPKPGIYPGLPMAEYLAMPAVSASLLKAMIDECPRAAWWRSWMNPTPPAAGSDATVASDAGTVAHQILLEGSADCVAVVDAKDWRTNAAKDAREAATAAGKIALLPHQMPKITAMVGAAAEFIDSLRESEPAIWAAFQPGGGESEVTMVWEERDGILCRLRTDRISTDRKVIVDYKTGGTTAEPDTWGRTQMVRMAYYVSAAHYRRGVKALCGEKPVYVWLVQEQEAPFLCSLVGIDPVGEELGDRKIARALTQWSACMKSGRWPGYPNRVVYPEIPAWEIAREEGALEERHAIPYDYEALGWKKPDRRGTAQESDPAWQ